MTTRPFAPLSRWYWLLALFGIWVAAHPYRGIWHDGLLYMAQALNKVNPQAFRHDVFFQYGSQDQFTLFSPLYAGMIAVLGVNHGTMALIVFCHALWALGLIALSRALLPQSARWLAVLLVAGMPMYYGALNVFSYTETFLTARLPAEAISLCAVAAILHRRAGLAIALAVFATLLHPLIGIWPLAWMVTLRFGWKRSLLLALLFGAIAFAAAPQRFLLHLDARWASLVKGNAGFLFIRDWGMTYWDNSCMTFATLLWAMQCSVKAHRRFWAVLCALVMIGTALSMMGDVSRSALLLQVQPWRILWLATVMSWLAIVYVAVKLWRTPEGWTWLVVWFSTWALHDTCGGIAALILLLPAWHYRQHWIKHCPPVCRTHYRALMVALLLVSGAAWLPNAIEDAQLSSGNFLYNTGSVQGLINGTAISQLILLPILLIWLMGVHLAKEAHSPRKMLVASVLSVFLLGAYALYGLQALDQRDPLTTYIETRLGGQQTAPLPVVLRPNSTVFWPNSLEFSWLGLRTGSYFSGKQVSGIIFNRKTTLESYRRAWRAVFLGVNMEGIGSSLSTQALSARLRPTGIHMDDDLHYKIPLSSTRSGLIYTCQDPVLDYLIIGTPIDIPGVPAQLMRLPVQPRRQWVYDCQQVREHFGVRADIQITP